MEALILLLLLMAARRSEGGGGGWEWERPQQQTSTPQLPPPRPTMTSTTPGETPWPQVLPPGLPAFPAGWEYDNPPPSEVKARASALLQTLWNTGQGSKLTEQTAGRWITYRAEITKGGKHGIVAYRLKKPAAVPNKPPPLPQRTAQQTPAPAPAPGPAPAQQQPPAVYTPTSTAPAPAPAAPAPAAPADTRPILHQGSGKGALVAQKPWVEIVQNKLRVDLSHGGRGEFGPLTFAAVKALQTRAGWTGKDVDGVVGPHTWALLDQLQANAA